MMLFKDITTFNDLQDIKEKDIADIILGSNTSIQKIKSIDITTLEYDSTLSRIIFNLIKVIQSRERKQKYFDECFENSLNYLKNTKIDYINNFAYIIYMLFLIKKTHKLDLRNYLNQYYSLILDTNESLDLLWLGEVFVTNGYCDKNTIEYILSKLVWQHENDFLNILNKCCKQSLNIENYYIEYAGKLEIIASDEKDYKSIYFYELAVDVYNKYQKTMDVDRIKLIKNKIPYNLQEHRVTLSEDIQKEFYEYIGKSKEMINDLVKNNENNKAFNLVFSNAMIPSKKENILNTINNQSTFRELGNITSVGDGTKFKFTNESDKKRYLEFENYRLSLDMNNHILSKLLNHLTKKVDIYSLIDGIYQNCKLYDKGREKIIKDLVIRYKNNDVIGFSYIFLPTFEYLIKEIMILNDESPYKTLKEEDKTLNKLLENSKVILVTTYGEDFYYLLENLFSYKFGLNIRNSLLHGDGMSFLDKKYTDILFFILVVLITYSRRVKDA